MMSLLIRHPINLFQRVLIANEATQIPWEAQISSAVHQAESRGLFKNFLVGGCCKATDADIARLRQQFVSGSNEA